EWFPRVEVARFDLFLCAFDRLGDHAMLDRNPFFHPEAFHPAHEAVAAEDAHQIVLEREVKARCTRIALTSRSSAKLIVDAPRLVPLRADDMQAAETDDFFVVALPLLADFLLDALALRGVGDLLRLLIRQKLGIAA